MAGVQCEALRNKFSLFLVFPRSLQSTNLVRIFGKNIIGHRSLLSSSAVIPSFSAFEIIYDLDFHRYRHVVIVHVRSPEVESPVACLAERFGRVEDQIQEEVRIRAEVEHPTEESSVVKGLG